MNLEALSKKSETEYDLNSEQNTVWITVENLSIYISRNDEGVGVSIYPLNNEDQDTKITETWALFSEGVIEDE